MSPNSASAAPFSRRSKLMGVTILTSLIIFVLFALLRFSSPFSEYPDATSLIIDPHKGSPELDSKQSTGDEVTIQTINPVPPKATDLVPVIPTSAFATHQQSAVAPVATGVLSSNSFQVHDRVAVIIETRALVTLLPLILHFSLVLGSLWPIILFTSESTIQSYQKARANLPTSFLRLVATGQIRLSALPADTSFANAEAVSQFLAGKWFWSQFESAEHVLLFQTDSIVCSNSATKVEDFFAYDFVGAPIAPQWGTGFNGGLSLRNANLSRQIVEKFSFEEEMMDKPSNQRVEDQWFRAKMGEMGGKFPSESEAVKFAVETVWGERPLGYHQVVRWNEDRLDYVKKWCPEYVLATSEYIGNGKDGSGGSGTIYDDEVVVSKGKKKKPGDGDVRMPQPT